MIRLCCNKLYFLLICLLLAIFDLLRLFGIDITGCAFGLSGVNPAINDAEENFIRPKDAEKLYFKHKCKTMLTNKFTGDIDIKSVSDTRSSPIENVVNTDMVNI